MTIARSASISLAVLSLAGCMSAAPPRPAMADTDVETAVVILPGSGAGEAVQAGCWATFFGERNFAGDSLTLIGPVALQSLDKGSARQLKRDIKSVAVGPRATLILYEKQFLSSRSVGFTPGTREAGLVEKLGFGGRVESMRLSCS